MEDKTQEIMDYAVLVDNAAGEEVLAVYPNVKLEYSTATSVSVDPSVCLVLTNRRLMTVNHDPRAGAVHRRYLRDSDYFCQSFDLFWVDSAAPLTYIQSGLFTKSISGLAVPFAMKSKLSIHAEEDTVTKLKTTLEQLPHGRSCVTVGGSEEVRWVGRPSSGAVPDLTSDESADDPGLFNGSHYVNMLVTRSSILIYRLDNVASLAIQSDLRHVDVVLGKPIVQYCRIPLSAVVRTRMPKGVVDSLGGGYITIVLTEPVSIIEVPGTTIYPNDAIVLEQEEFVCAGCSRHVSGTLAEKAADGASVGWKCGGCERVICTRCRKDHSFLSRKAPCPGCNLKALPSGYVDSSLYGVRVSAEVATEVSRYAAAPRDSLRTFEQWVKAGSMFDSSIGFLKNPMKRQDNPLLRPEVAGNSILSMRPVFFGKRGQEWSLKLAPFEGSEGLWECLVECGVPN